MVAEEHLQFCAFLKHDQHAAVHHQIGHLTLGIAGRGLKDIDDLNGTIDLHVARHIDQQAVLGQHRIERRHSII